MVIETRLITVVNSDLIKPQKESKLKAITNPCKL